MNKVWIKLICAFVGGGAVGYFVGKKISDNYWMKEYAFQEHALAKAVEEYTGNSDDEIEKEDYHDYSSVIPEDKPDLETLAAKYTDEEHPEDDIPEEPYLITMEEFDEESGDRIILKFYEGDGTLTDENDIPIEDPDKYVGDTLSMLENNNDVIFVKNPASGTRYEISQIDGSYEEIILGVQPTDESSRMRRRRMRDE